VELSKFILGRIYQNLFALASIGVLFWVFAGTLWIPGLWLYFGVVMGYQVISLLYIVPRHPEFLALAEARRKKPAGAKAWDRYVVLAVMVCTFLMYVLAAWDLGTLRIGLLPVAVQGIGVISYIAGSAVNHWAMLNNPFFEREVRIQTDRNQQVTAVGPYRHIRHPGYLGSVLGLLAFPLILGSGLALIGGFLAAAGMILRTGLEDRTLLGELEGYREYADIVRFRLVPGVW
jgi:protein-S-isoprenylcysteine O-methyltransferase Ste14